MKAMIFEYVIDPIIAASGGRLSGLDIAVRVLFFLAALFALMYGLPACMVALG